MAQSRASSGGGGEGAKDRVAIRRQQQDCLGWLYHITKIRDRITQSVNKSALGIM